MLSSAAEYRRMAEHYFSCAYQMSDPGDRAALLRMAEYWKKLAEQAEQNERDAQEEGKAKKPAGI
jgi:predicted acetyltransferase